MSNNHGTSVIKDWEGTSFPAPKGTSNSSTWLEGPKYILLAVSNLASFKFVIVSSKLLETHPNVAHILHKMMTCDAQIR